MDGTCDKEECVMNVRKWTIPEQWLGRLPQALTALVLFAWAAAWPIVFCALGWLSAVGSIRQP